MKEIGIPHSFSTAADHVTLSFGVAALVPQKEQDPSELLRLADESSLYGEAERQKPGAKLAARAEQAIS